MPHTMSSPPLGDIGSLLHEVRSQFEQQLSIESLLVLSNKVQAEFREHLISSPQCMLPSFNYSLPTGQEQGKYLALEVGGSTLRMALLELCGRDAGIQPMQLRTIPIENSVRQLPQYEFFDWMAEHIGTALYEDSRHTVHMPDTEPLRMGVAWAFPIASVWASLHPTAPG